ncbi:MULTISPECIES: cysteine--tRNA ligase [Aerococcus]|uniref:cysteine--tRNA ligase n=1 Tax=Aerococcus TaxID=1375 RepID=UPI0018A70FA0|nr:MULTISPECIES: cysteine--tRNA ligase [Aerococcus]MCY3036895.1 cysteine--tRNA ligase [Aerococcus sp. Group 2]MCY3040337.1 cysteine--tRNA ligase [Aerococcus sp. Group 2]MCY3042040.1 cysteine--tRNA ligase [Aerococcus sp. Group 2]MCY3043753.1 cysteine--tRNA ligase [Aerococcus sp. Group 2]MDK6521459.1 cysteine--tRNA ligase [Aerococcus urinae]
MLTVYNTLTKSKEEFHPINEGKVNMYVCGPTVYNYIHIGNARSIVAFDVIRRYLEYRGYEVNFVSNFTDVDDKIIKRGQEEGITSREVADKYIAAYYEDIDKLNVKRATLNPRVLENIDAIIEFVQDLVDKDYAYVVDGDVYYRARSFSSYGKLSDQSIDDLRSGASERVSADEQGKKEDSVDFALWKAAKAGEPSWDSPWGAGRPGWHIECSVMSTRYLADTLDIHGGGADLVFPHHENERAQSEARTGKTFVNYWLHNGFVTMGDDGEKMSKSLGNFVLAHDLLKEVDPTIVRFFLASAHYRAPVKFSHSNLEEAQRNLERLQTAHDNINYRLQDAKESLADDEKQLGELQALDEHFIQVMDDDFNVPNALTVIYEALKRINIYMEAPQVSQAVLKAYDQQLGQWLAIIGIEFQDATILDSEVQALIEERDQARLDKDYDRSDAIRQELLDQGIILDDTPQGTRWRRSK